MIPKLYRQTLIMALLCLLIPAMAPAAPSSDLLTSVTTGHMKIYNQDIPNAKKNAVNQALEMAVQNAFASLVSRQVFASNLEFLYDRLIPGADEYVVTYRVLDEIQHKGRYLVGVESKIDLAQMRQRLEEARIIRTGQEKPVILMLVAEQTPGELLPKYWWGNNPEPYASLAETILREELTARQIPLVGTDYPEPGFYAIQFQGIYDTRAAMDLGTALKADMVILGKANATESSNRMGVAKTFEAVIDLRGFNLTSGKEIFQIRTQATASSDMADEGAAQSLTKAAQEAARDLGIKVESVWAKNLRKESLFDVAVEGEHFLPRFIALKRRFKDIRDIVNMQPKEIGSDSAVMEVVYKGSPEQFADAVLLKTFADFGLEIAEVTPETVHIRFVEKMAEEPRPAPAQEKPADEATDETAPQ